MTKFKTAQAYTACYALLRRGDELAFVLRKNTSWMDGYYGLPSGKVEWGETFSAGLIREAKEEVAIDILPEHVHHAITIHRHSDDADWVDVYFEVEAWQGEVINAEPDVHSEVAWLNMHELPDNIVPAVRFALEQIAAGNHYAECDWVNS